MAQIKLFKKDFFKEFHWQVPLFIFAISFVLFLMGSSQADLYITDEARNAECAREMLEQGKFAFPTYNYGLRTDKPPLHYYFMILGYTFFGVNPFGARFFSAVFGALTMLIVFIYTKRFSSARVALFTVLVLLSSIHFIFQFHLAVPDPYLIFFLTLTFLSFYAVYKQGKTFDIILAYVSCGLGTLSKGPVALILPVISVFLFLILKRDFKWKTIKRFRIGIGLLLFIISALPLYAWLHFETEGAWTYGFFVNHNISRYLSPREGHSGFFLMPFIYVFAGMLPFSVFIFNAIAKVWRERKHYDFVVYSAIVVLSIVCFFAASETKLPNYTVPAYPFLAIILAFYLEGVCNQETFRKTKTWIWLIILSIITILLPIVLWFAPNYDETLLFLRSEVLKITPLAIGAIIGFLFALNGRYKHFLVSLTAGSVLTSVFLFYSVLPNIDARYPVNICKEEIFQAEQVAYWGRFSPEILFSLKKEITQLKNKEEFESFIKNNPDGLIISTRRHLNRLDIEYSDFTKEVCSAKEFFEGYTTVLLKFNPE